MNDLLAFVRAHPVAGAPVDKAAWFLGELCRGPEAWIDLAVHGRRALVGVVIDTCESADDGAELVVLGRDREVADEAALRAAIDRARAFAAGGPRSALEVMTPGPFPVQLLEGAGFRPSYQLHEMQRQGAPVPAALLPGGLRWADADRAMGAQLHAVTRAAFASVPGSFVAPVEVLVERLERQPHPTRVLLEGERVIAFVRPEGPVDGVGTIGVLGVLPSAQGRGLGRLALREGLAALAARGAGAFRLDVAVRNERALRLYESEGFSTVQVQTAWALPLRRAD